MGRWDEGLFGGDTDLDEASFISEDAGIELYAYEVDTEHPDRGGKGLEATRAHLNSGVLNELMVKYATSDNPHKAHNDMVCKELRLVFLAALAMRVGATIEPEHLTLLRGVYPKIRVSPKYSLPLFDSDIRAPAKKQFEIALAHYKNDGTPYNFYAERCARSGCDLAQDELVEGETLKKCAKCRLVSYCGKECQAADWVAHKKGCKTPEKRAEADLKRWGNGPRSLNV